MKTNVLGTDNVLTAAIEAGALCGRAGEEDIDFLMMIVLFWEIHLKELKY